tara:strand:- start:4302 stop:5045 length:744 start_codon:yes stop_codon:yes gene_type:complete
MSIFYAGDVHGNVDAFHAIETNAANINAVAIIQVGDFGIFWPDNKKAVAKYFDKRHRQGKLTIPWYFTDGNHEEHDVLDQMWVDAGRPDVVEVAPNCFHVRRGTVIEIDGLTHLFCGGAASVDRSEGFREFIDSNGKRRRIWWPQEAPNKEELQLFLDNMEARKPDVVVTHDVPTCIDIYGDQRRGDPTAHGFKRILDMSTHRPKRWFFGHHHLLEEWASDYLFSFYCCGKDGAGWSWHEDKVTKKS